MSAPGSFKGRSLIGGGGGGCFLIGMDFSLGGVVMGLRGKGIPADFAFGSGGGGLDDGPFDLEGGEGLGDGGLAGGFLNFNGGRVVVDEGLASCFDMLAVDLIVGGWDDAFGLGLGLIYFFFFLLSKGLAGVKDSHSSEVSRRNREKSTASDGVSSGFMILPFLPRTSSPSFAPCFLPLEIYRATPGRLNGVQSGRRGEAASLFVCKLVRSVKGEQEKPKPDGNARE